MRGRWKDPADWRYDAVNRIAEPVFCFPFLPPPMTDLPPERVQPLNDAGLIDSGSYVLYWMQQAQRAAHNGALHRAIQHANDEGLPLRVVFGLMDGYPEANLRHYTFMLQGLRETQHVLAERPAPETGQQQSSLG